MATGEDYSDDTPYGPPSPYDVPSEYGPPNPFEATPGEPGSYGPPKDVFTSTPSPEVTTPSTAGDKTDYSSILTTVVKTAGDVAKAATEKPASSGGSSVPSAPRGGAPQGSPLPVAASGSPGPPAKAPVSGGAIVAIGIGSAAVLTLVALAATRKARR